MDGSNIKSPAERFDELRIRAGWAIEKLAKAMGYAGASSVQRYFSAAETPGDISLKFILKVVEHFVGRGTPPIEEHEIYELAGQPGLLLYEKTSAGGSADHPSIPRGMEVSDPIAMDPNARRDLPVYASAEGGPSGSMIISAEPIDWVKRPEPLLNVRNAFACYVLGDSMSPAYDHGDLLLVDPSKPIKGNDDCLFVREHADGTRDALIKRLVRALSDRWKVQQFKPEKNFELLRSDWGRVMKVRGKYRD